MSDDEHDEESIPTGEDGEATADPVSDADATENATPVDSTDSEGGSVDPVDVDIDPADVAVDDISDLSTEELIALSGGGVVDAEGDATAFGEADVVGETTPAGGADEEQTAEETAEQLVENLDEISEEENSTQQEMFTDAWMAKHTDFESIEAFLAAGAWPEGTEIWDVPTDDLDAHAAAHSAFDTWQEMSQAAGDEWMDDRLSFLADADGEE